MKPSVLIHLGIAVTALFALTLLTSLTLYYRKRFVLRYPEFSKAYLEIALGLVSITLAKLAFFPLDLRDCHLYSFGERVESFLGTLGNLLLFMGLLVAALGWTEMITSITGHYELVPVVEVSGKPEDMKPGVYLVPSRLGLNPLTRLLKGRASVIVTRKMPDEIRATLNLKETPILWITTAECTTECVHPRRMEYLLHTLINFMRKEKSPKLIYLDGLEYLVLENGFVPVFKFLSTLKDYAVLNNTVILVPVEKFSFDEREWNLLRREFGCLNENSRSRL
jgi:hypothetical protein